MVLFFLFHLPFLSFAVEKPMQPSAKKPHGLCDEKKLSVEKPKYSLTAEMPVSSLANAVVSTFESVGKTKVLSDDFKKQDKILINITCQLVNKKVQESFAMVSKPFKFVLIDGNRRSCEGITTQLQDQTRTTSTFLPIKVECKEKKKSESYTLNDIAVSYEKIAGPKTFSKAGDKKTKMSDESSDDEGSKSVVAPR